AAVAAAPQAGFLGGLAAPQQARGVAPGLPLLGGVAELLEERGILVVLVEPAPQQRPAVDQRLVDQLDGGARGGAAALGGGGLADQQARADEAIDEAVDLGGIGRQLVELGDGREGAGALGGDQAQEQRADQRLLALAALGDDRVGVARQRAGDAADAVVAVDGEPAARAVAHLPELGGGELQERQCSR